MPSAKCHQCRGKGYRVNPAVESPGGGITSSEMEEILMDDPDFIVNYLDGVYDIECDLCSGTGRLDMSEEAIQQRRWDAEARAEQRAEMGMLGEY